MFEVRIPSLGESVTEARIARWAKADGESVAQDEVLFELESDKASMELPAERAGVLHIVKQEGETVVVGDLVARIEDGAGAGATPARAPVPATGHVPSPPPARACRRFATSVAAREQGGGPTQPGGAKPDRGARPRPRRDRGFGQGRAAHQGRRARASRGPRRTRSGRTCGRCGGHGAGCRKSGDGAGLDGVADRASGASPGGRG